MTSGFQGPADIGIRRGKIAKIGDLGTSESGAMIRATGLHVLPGVIDSHVHFREPGGESKETLASGSKAAVLGGVTTVFDMPNTSPAVTTDEVLDRKLARAAGRLYCDYAFYIGATPENAAWLAEAERREGVAGIKLFMGSSTGELLVEDEEDIRTVLSAGQRRVAVHAEDEKRLRARRGRIKRGDPASHPVWRDADAALRASRRLIRIARQTRRPVHVLHVSTQEEIPLLAANRDLATAEVTPHHLTLAAEDAYSRLGNLAQVNPPVRQAVHRDALIAAVANGVIDTIGSDHAPHTRDEKTRAYPESPSGFPGVATLLPVMLEHAAAGRIPLQKLIHLFSEGPARVFGILGKGRVQEGFDADLTLVDLAARRRIENGTWVSRVGWTPYSGMEVRGWPVATIVRGKVAMREGEIVEEPSGEPVGFRAPGTK